jgi:hypothetical protein
MSSLRHLNLKHYPNTHVVLAFFDGVLYRVSVNGQSVHYFPAEGRREAIRKFEAWLTLKYPPKF